MRASRFIGVAVKVVVAASMIGGAVTATQASAAPSPTALGWVGYFFGYGPSASAAIANAEAQEPDCFSSSVVFVQQIAPTNWEAEVKAGCLPPGT